MDYSTKGAPPIRNWRFPQKLSLERIPAKWDPRSIHHYFAGVVNTMALLSLVDSRSHPSHRRDHPSVAPVFEVFKRLFNGDRDKDGIAVMGGGAYEDPTGAYTCYWKEVLNLLFQDELARRARQEKERQLLLVTGGGLGFAMKRTCECFHQMMDSLTLDESYGIVAQILADFREYEGNGLATPGYTVRPQSVLATRYMGLSAPVSTVMLTPFGFGGFEEAANALLENQLHKAMGPNVVGPRLVIIVDTKLTGKEIAIKYPRYQVPFRLASRERWFDGMESQVRSMFASGTAHWKDFFGLRVCVDEDPLAAAATTAQAILHWQELRRAPLDSQGVGHHAIEHAAVLRAMELIETHGPMYVPTPEDAPECLQGTVAA